MDFSDLTEVQKAKIRECKTPEEMLALAREEGYELTDDQLEAVSGGYSRTE
ncbi:MAG: Nif11-like leader peptide family natural product precursor [Eggerthellaceae bacterium]|nr:Nif11-like leader peptide family natural product precursor [Eggerthellaceae bacterium]